MLKKKLKEQSFVTKEPQKEEPHWFMISTIVGREWTVKETLQSLVEKSNLKGVLPEIKLYELKCKEGQSNTGRLPAKSTENMYPGYVFIKALMTDELWYLIRNTKYVTGLLGSSGKGARPTKISVWKMKKYDDLHQTRLKNFCEEVAKRGELTAGMLVKVIEGTYRGHLGKVYSSYAKQNICFVTLDYFGKRITREIEIDYLEVVDV